MPKLIDRFVNKAIAVLSSYKDKQEVKSYIAGIRSSYKKLAHKTELTKEQEYEIQEYFTKLLGHPVPLDWHRYFTARTGVFSKRYVPTSEYKTNIIGRLNVYPLKRAYTDKNITDIILQNIRQPKIYLKNINGFFYYNGKPVTKAEAINLCQGLGEVIIKPSLTGRGVGVRKINIINGKSQNDGKDLSVIIDEYKQDYLIEELVRQHHQMSALNPSSINTIRVLTYRSNMEVKIVYSVIRIGRKGQDIDNESAGGISTSISKEGKLGKYAYGAPGADMIEYTDSGVKLENYQIPSYEKVVDLVKQAHYQLPYFKLMGWDIAITEDGEPIMIEFNMTPDLSQSAYGPAFGEYTEIILNDAMNHKNTWSKFALDCMWKKN